MSFVGGSRRTAAAYETNTRRRDRGQRGVHGRGDGGDDDDCSSSSSHQGGGRRMSGTDPEPDSSNPLFLREGSRIAVYWQGDDQYYVGTLAKIFRRGHKKEPYFVKYDDGDEAWYNLEDGSVLWHFTDTARPSRRRGSSKRAGNNSMEEEEDEDSSEDDEDETEWRGEEVVASKKRRKSQDDRERQENSKQPLSSRRRPPPRPRSINANQQQPGDKCNLDPNNNSSSNNNRKRPSVSAQGAAAAPWDGRSSSSGPVPGAANKKMKSGLGIAGVLSLRGKEAQSTAPRGPVILKRNSASGITGVGNHASTDNRKEKTQSRLSKLGDSYVANFGTKMYDKSTGEYVEVFSPLDVNTDSVFNQWNAHFFHLNKKLEREKLSKEMPYIVGSKRRNKKSQPNRDDDKIEFRIAEQSSLVTQNTKDSALGGGSAATDVSRGEREANIKNPPTEINKFVPSLLKERAHSPALQSIAEYKRNAVGLNHHSKEQSSAMLLDCVLKVKEELETEIGCLTKNEASSKAQKASLAGHNDDARVKHCKELLESLKGLDLSMGMLRKSGIVQTVTQVKEHQKELKKLVKGLRKVWKEKAQAMLSEIIQAWEKGLESSDSSTVLTSVGQFMECFDLPQGEKRQIPTKIVEEFDLCRLLKLSEIFFMEQNVKLDQIQELWNLISFEEHQGPVPRLLSHVLSDWSEALDKDDLEAVKACVNELHSYCKDGGTSKIVVQLFLDPMIKTGELIFNKQVDFNEYQVLYDRMATLM